jgi:exodeoxyribonuclease VIII
VNEPKPGLYRNVAFDTYASWDAVNHGLLEEVRKAPAKGLYYLQHCGREETDALRKGWATHVAVLEPKVFEQNFVAAPQCDKRTTAGKALYAEFAKAAEGLTILDADEMASCQAMRDSVWAHPTARLLLEGKGTNEASMLWQDRETELLCKGRMDRLSDLNGQPCIVDLKTSRDGERRAFEKSIYNFGYHRQAARYLEGANALAPLERKFIWIVVESAPPHLVAVYEIEPAALSMGIDENRASLQKWADCKKLGQYPGYDDGIDYAGLPAWAYKAIEDAA